MSILPCNHPNTETIFTCAQAGCSQCMEFLLERHKGLIHAVIRYAEFGGIPYTDAFQEGQIGLWRAILLYDPYRQVAFSTYAWPSIKRRIWHHLLLFRKKDESLEEEPFEWGCAHLAEEAWQQAQVAAALREALDSLPERLKRVVAQYYGLADQPPLTLERIGQEMGLTRERVRQLRNEALLLLRLPAISIRLRNLAGKDSRQEYRQARTSSNAWLRARRGLK
jgi:RNA polymerase sigma factor (sigma-70 family)